MSEQEDDNAFIASGGESAISSSGTVHAKSYEKPLPSSFISQKKFEEYLGLWREGNHKPMILALRAAFKPMAKNYLTQRALYNIEWEDLVAEAEIKALHLIEKGETKIGVILVAARYAFVDHVRENASLFLSGRTARDFMQQILTFEKQAQGLDYPAKEALAREMGTTLNEILMKAQLLFGTASLYSPVKPQDKGSVSFEDITPESINSDPAEQMQAMQHTMYVLLLMEHAGLNTRERFIIYHRYLAPELCEFKTLGASFGVTESRAKQIETAAIKKIRDFAAKLEYEDDDLDCMIRDVAQKLADGEIIFDLEHPSHAFPTTTLHLER